MHNQWSIISIAIIFSLLVTIPASNSMKPEIYTTEEYEKTIIKVALYDMNSPYNTEQFEAACNYKWIKNNKEYSFDIKVIDKKDVLGYGKNPLNNENFDVFIISASAKSYLFDGINDRWKENVQKFVANGGGYLGVCGGANAGSQGFENPENIFHYRVNQGVLGLADVYINDYFLGEWQYLLKIGFGSWTWTNITVDSYPSYISVNTTVQQNRDNVIFSVYNQKYRDISYAGGPGLYTAYKQDSELGEIIPLLVYNEEPMYTKPIHYWNKDNNNWQIVSNITTNLSGTYAGIATTYNDNGRVVLYGPHPEYPYVVVNGSIIEYQSFGYLSRYHNFSQYVYNYVGNLMNFSYNIWIIRRSIAWAAHISDEDLPPLDESSIWLTEPDQYGTKIYINGQEQKGKMISYMPAIFKNINSFIIGGFTIEAETSANIKQVEFYIDDDLIDTKNQPDYTFFKRNYYSATINNSPHGLHTITVKAINEHGDISWDDSKAYFINI